MVDYYVTESQLRDWVSTLREMRQNSDSEIYDDPEGFESLTSLEALLSSWLDLLPWTLGGPLTVDLRILRGSDKAIPSVQR